jgi:uncharacterized iron-regulated membrane protein
MSDDIIARAGLYRTIWRWHFYAGLFVAPVLALMAVTGALYLYKIEMETLWYGDLVAASEGTPLPASAQQAAVLAAYPGATVTRYILPPAEGRASEWAIRFADGRDPLTVFIDPAKAEVTGAIDPSWRLMSVISDLHGGAIAGDIGGYVVELAACWAFILLVTGVFLWWPRGRKGGIVLPRVRSRGRTLLRDLHAVPAMWNVVIVGFLILSGLPWSIFWGNQLASLGTLSAATSPTPNFSEGPAAPVHDEHTEAGNRDIPWTIRNAPQMDAPLHDHHTIPPGIDAIMQEAAVRGIDKAGLRVFLPSRPGATIMLSYVPDKAQDQRTVDLDPGTGAVIRDVGWDGYSPLGKAVEFGTMAHMGRQLGEPNRLLMLASCVLLVLTIVMGVVMWWTRRPARAMGAPKVPAGFQAGAGVVAIAATLGIVFPLAGASMLAILLIELALKYTTGAGSASNHPQS